MTSYFLLIVILLLLATGVLRSNYFFKISPLVFGLFFGAFYFLFIPLLYLLINGNLPVPSSTLLLHSLNLKEDTLNLFFLALYVSGIFVVFFFWMILARKDSVVIINKFSHSKELRIYIASIIIYFLFSLFVLFSSGLLAGGHWYITRSEYISESGSGVVIIFYLLMGLKLIIVSSTFELLERKMINLLTAGLIFFIISSYELFFVGNRIIVLMFGVVGLLFCVRLYGYLKSILLTFIVFPFALFLAVFQEARYLIFTASILDVVNYTIFVFFNRGMERVSMFILTIFEYSGVLVMFNIFDDISKNLLQPVYGVTFLKLFTWLIPRSIWAAKPESVDLLLGRLYNPDFLYSSLIPYIFGEFHFNFGILGFVFFPLFIFAIFTFINNISSRMISHTYLIFLVGFLSFRTPISGIVVSTIFGVLIYKTLSFVLMLKENDILLASVKKMNQ